MGAPHSNGQAIAPTRFPSHQLSNGLYVSGLPDQNKEKGTTIGVSQMPYTGGDVKKSGELGKMFDIPVESSASGKLRKSGGITSSTTKPGGFGGPSSHSGPLPSNAASQTPFVAYGPLSATGPSKASVKPGGQVSKSGPLIGSMAEATRQSSNSGPLTRSAGLASGSLKMTQDGKFAGTPTSGPILRNSGSLGLALPATGLITSGPISSGPIACATGPCRKGQSGPLDVNGASGKLVSGSGACCSSAINCLSHDKGFSLRRNLPKVVLWTVVPVFVIGFIAGSFILAAVQNAILLIIVAGLFITVVVLLFWNIWWGKSSVTGFLAKYPDSELGSAKDGQYVKITGVVTCGSVPLESSYQKVNRCMYTSTGLYEYRNFFSKPANESHRRFSWGLRHMERHVVDFYISDLQTGLRALVKAGYGARITPFVQESAVVDVTPKLKELPSEFLRWLTERKLSRDDRIMQLREGYIKEGSTVTVLGVVQRHENVLMIVPPPEVVSTGCQWTKLLLPAKLEGIILACDEVPKNEGIPL